jgi:hypothetical protein
MDTEAITETSARMIAAAMAADWEQVAQLNAQRDRQMRDCDAAELAPLLPRLAEDTERLLALARQARTASRDALGQLRRGQRAAHVYAESGHRMR